MVLAKIDRYIYLSIYLVAKVAFQLEGWSFTPRRRALAFWYDCNIQLFHSIQYTGSSHSVCFTFVVVLSCSNGSMLVAAQPSPSRGRAAKLERGRGRRVTPAHTAGSQAGSGRVDDPIHVLPPPEPSEPGRRLRPLGRAVGALLTRPVGPLSPVPTGRCQPEPAPEPAPGAWRLPELEDSCTRQGRRLRHASCGQPEPEPEPKSELEPEPEPEPKPGPEPEGEPEPKPELEPKLGPEAEPVQAGLMDCNPRCLPDPEREPRAQPPWGPQLRCHRKPQVEPCLSPQDEPGGPGLSPHDEPGLSPQAP